MDILDPGELGAHCGWSGAAQSWGLVLNKNLLDLPRDRPDGAGGWKDQRILWSSF